MTRAVAGRTGGSDYLLSVADAPSARAALDASERLVLPDGRATPWLAVDRLAGGVPVG